jgi:hypothetical protein
MFRDCVAVLVAVKLIRGCVEEDVDCVGAFEPMKSRILLCCVRRVMAELSTSKFGLLLEKGEIYVFMSLQTEMEEGK